MSKWRPLWSHYRNRPEVRFALHPLHQQVDGTDLVSYARSVELEHLSFVDYLESCFGVLASIEDHPDSDDSRRLLGTDHVDTGPWRCLTEYFYPGNRWTEERQGAMLHASPERVNLSLNLVDDYRREYLPLILGSGYSRWTNVSVCQVFSRLLTGKAVEARFIYDLVESLPVSLEQPEWPDAGIPERARATMLQAMQDVPRYGTAEGLYTTIRTTNSRWAPQGYRAGVFGKTGTPALVVYEIQERTKALNNLIETQALHVSPADGYIYYRDSGPILDEGDVSAALAAIRASSRDASAFAGLDAKWSKRALNRCRWYNERSARDRAFLFEVENGVLVRAFGSTEDMTHGAAFAFVFGRYPGSFATGDFGVLPLAEPERALAVSVIFEKRGMSSGDIMPLVSKLMEEVMVDALEAGW